MKIEIVGKLKELANRQRDVLCICSADRLAKQVPLPAHVVLSVQAEFTFPATEVGVDDDSIARPDPSPLSYGGREVKGNYYTCAIRAIDVRKFESEAKPAIANHHIHAVQSRGVQSDKSLSRFRFGSGKVSVLKDLWSTVLVE
jgi:hypothetical protein